MPKNAWIIATLLETVTSITIFEAEDALAAAADGKRATFGTAETILHKLCDAGRARCWFNETDCLYHYCKL